MKYLFLLCCFFYLSGIQAQVPVETLLGNLRARQIGPATTSGRIASIDAVHRRPEIIYVGTAGGGVWKTNSGGASFAPVFDEHVQAIGKIVIDQQHPDTVWVGTGEPWVRNSVSPGNGVYRTVNGGKTWEHLGLTTTERISDILIHPSNPDIVYVAAQGHLWDAHPDRGVYKTTDGGKSW
ncbi:MAG: WD40/YVTN/BNR-like repeat-containing protein, partial [Haliscomenobacter sp.]